MEQRYLRQFIAVAEEHCFSQAAQRLGITQPALSRQIQKLEEELGLPLFHRTTRRVELTAAGQVFLDEVRRGLQQMDRAVQAARRVDCGEAGQLAIGFVSAAACSVLPAILRCCHERYPRVALEVAELDSERQMQALDEGRLQIGLLHPPPAGRELIIEPILAEGVVVALPRGHTLARAPRVHLGDLAHETLIICRREHEPALFDGFMRLCAGEGFAPNLLFGPSSLHLIVSLVAAGLGYTLAPASARNLHVGPPDVVYRAIHPQPPKLVLAAAWRADDPSPALTGFLDIVRDVAHQGRGLSNGRYLPRDDGRDAPVPSVL